MLQGAMIAFVLAVILFGGGLYYYFTTGMAPVATADPWWILNVFDPCGRYVLKRITDCIRCAVDVIGIYHHICRNTGRLSANC